MAKMDMMMIWAASSHYWKITQGPTSYKTPYILPITFRPDKRWFLWLLVEADDDDIPIELQMRVWFSTCRLFFALQAAKRYIIVFLSLNRMSWNPIFEHPITISHSIQWKLSFTTHTCPIPVPTFSTSFLPFHFDSSSVEHPKILLDLWWKPLTKVIYGEMLITRFVRVKFFVKIQPWNWTCYHFFVGCFPLAWSRPFAILSHICFYLEKLDHIGLSHRLAVDISSC